MQPNATTGLLPVVAVLLAANLVVRMNREVEAHPQVQIAPSVTGIALSATGHMLRVWSDGIVEQRPIAGNDITGLLWPSGSKWAEIQELPPD